MSYEKNSQDSSEKQKRMNKVNESSLISSTRFPLTFAVVMIHTLMQTYRETDVNGLINSPFSFNSLFSIIQFSINDVLFRLAVPIFYVLSGYLFFKNISEFNSKVYFKKMSTRIYTLLIPYLLWNLLMYIVFLAHCMSKHEMPSLTSFISAFWSYDRVFPIVGQSYYIRDLIILILETPIIYFFLKKLKYIFVIICGILFIIFNYWGIPGFSFLSLFFFSLGAYFGTNKKQLFGMIPLNSKKNRIMMTFIYLSSMILLMTTSFLNSYQTKLGLRLLPVFIIFGVFAFFNTWHYIPQKLIPFFNRYAKYSLFIFFIHTFYLFSKFDKVMADTFFVSPLGIKIGIWVITPTLKVTVAIMIFLILQKACPKFLRLLVGFR